MHAVQLTSMTVGALKDIEGVTAREAERAKNMFALGLMSWLYGRNTETTKRFLETKFAKRPEIAAANIKAFSTGYAFGETSEGFAVQYEVKPAALTPGTYRQITGNVALSWGLLAASKLSQLPLFLGAYPITPASSILEELAKHKAFGVRTFQAEDEIAAVGAALGASFGGSLGVTTSAGPGVVLKSETVGLAIALELPLLVIDVQRAGPSTGMPTKPEQGDLLMVLFGRNSESPVPVIAASSPGDCFYAAIDAVRVALTYRTPVYLLSDAYLANGAEPWPVPDIDSLAPIDGRVRGGERRAVPAVQPRPGDARAALGDPRHARARAPHRRSREGERHRRDLLRRRQPRPDDAAARPEGRRGEGARRRGRPPGGRRPARPVVGRHVRAGRRRRPPRARDGLAGRACAPALAEPVPREPRPGAARATTRC